VQVDPVKPTLNAPGSKCLKLDHEKLLSNFAFNFNLRRYVQHRLLLHTAQGEAVQVDPIKPTLKAPGSERLKLKCDILLSACAFNVNLRRYTKEDYLQLLKLYPLEEENLTRNALVAGPCTPPLFSST